MARVGSILNKILHSFEVALRGSDTECCAAIVIISVNSPTLIFKDRHVLNIILKGGIEKTVIVVI